MDNVDIINMLLVLSTLVILCFLLLVAKRTPKKQIHYAVLSMTASILLWNVAVLLHLTFDNVPWILAICERLYFLGTILVSISILFTGLIFARTKIKFTWKHALLFVVPVISIVVLLTNQSHHLFYTVFSLIPSKQTFGIYFTIHTIYSYSCIGIGLAYLVIFSIKNYGVFSKQSSLIVIGIMISLIIDAISTFKIFDWSTAIENIAFAVTISFFIIATVKFDFLNVIPIALQTVVDLISDSYVVIDEDFKIIDYNKAFVGGFTGVSRKIGIMAVIKKNYGDLDVKRFMDFLGEAVHDQKKVSFEMPKPVGEAIAYYMVKITPIYVSGNHIGTIILKQNITEHKNNLKEVMQLNERLQSLATRDWLTQSYNRYFFDERLQQEIDLVNRLQAYGQEPDKSVKNFGLIMFDIDYFKIYNDNNGHLAGDELLQTIVTVVKEALYPTDILCRYGGEEFAVICCHTSEKGIKIAAEKIRKTVEDYAFKFQDKQPGDNLTVSIGAAYYSTANIKREELIKRADNCLYLAKSSGRNKAVFDA
ncbi:diguanylate cyclase [Desulforamulus aeronauticus]|uniref:Diguanylate cyclase (GGDEF) domain-containing protein n=1 Tax=Desulforamulus aeronauticus DSM 10349 TaxID=1121421 RepID=A0A1M6TYD4_9FIRM|nr:diguanylate cyclase [Desulforamulus aeronauticus]SHK61921.1 diguanylate cyclase (GGDEF) domain-containing protein [Desulforamulus aeronauticus DSM 10349]